MDAKGMKPMGLLMASGVPLSRIGDILRGKTRNPQINTVVKLAKALDMTVDELVVEAEEPGRMAGNG